MRRPRRSLLSAPAAHGRVQPQQSLWHTELWHTEPDGVLAAEADDFRLVVRRVAEGGGFVRFMVLRRQHGTGGPFALVASGTKDGVHEAMTAAERMAGRAVL